MSVRPDLVSPDDLLVLVRAADQADVGETVPQVPEVRPQLKIRCHSECSPLIYLKCLLQVSELNDYLISVLTFDLFTQFLINNIWRRFSSGLTL